MLPVSVRRYFRVGFFGLALASCRSQQFSFQPRPDTLVTAIAQPAASPAPAPASPAVLPAAPAPRHSARTAPQAPTTAVWRRPLARPAAQQLAVRRPRTTAAPSVRHRAPRLRQGSWLQIAAWVLGIGAIGLGVLLSGWLGLLVALVLVAAAILLGLVGSFSNGNMP